MTPTGPARRLRLLAIPLVLTVLAAAGCVAGDPDPAPPVPAPSPTATASPVIWGFDAALHDVVRPTEEGGGVLRLGATADCPSWDPARVSLAWCQDMQRLITRTLVGFAPAPGAAGTALLPDLAESLGRPNADRTQWTYRLRDGVRWQDGSAVTSRDVKYGIERLFAADVGSGGLGGVVRPLLDLCSNPSDCSFPGPYAGSVTGLDSIRTPDDRTIVFTLTRPYNAFDAVLALPATAPVPRSLDLGVDYGTAVQSSGPYLVASYRPGAGMTLVSNPRWDPATDPIRRPLAGEVHLTIAPQADIDRALASGELDLAADGLLGARFADQVLAAPTVRRNADSPATGAVDYLAVTDGVPPLQRLGCREAVAAALDRRAAQAAAGGALLAARAATVMTPPNLPAHASLMSDPTFRVPLDGDDAAARAALVRCGEPDGFALRMAHIDDERGAAVAAAVAAGLARAGISVTAVAIPPVAFHGAALESPRALRRAGIGLVLRTWEAPLPNTYGFWQGLVADPGDPVVDALVASPAATSPLPAVQADIGGRVERAVAAQAMLLPLLHRARLAYRGSRTTAIYANGALANLYDYVNVGVSDG